MRKRTIRGLALLIIATMVFAMMPLSVAAASKAPGKAKVSSAKISNKKASTANVTLKWKKVKNATAYEIYQKRANQTKYTKVRTLGKNARSVKLKNLKSGKYSFKIRAIRKVGGKVVAGAYSDAKSKFISSTLKVQQLVNKYPAMKTQLIKSLGSVMETGASCPYGKLSYSGNTVLLDIDAQELANKASDLPLAEILQAYSTAEKTWNQLPTETKELAKLTASNYAKSLSDEAKKLATKVSNETGVNASNIKIKVRIQYAGFTVAEKQF